MAMDTDLRIIVAADHNGIDLKAAILEHLVQADMDVTDGGVNEEATVDYPDVAARIAAATASGDFDRAVLICGTGAGMAIVANKVPGIRAVCVGDPHTAERARASNDAQVITFGSQVVTSTLAIRLLDIWLSCEFQGGRSQRKVEKIGEVESRYLADRSRFEGPDAPA